MSYRILFFGTSEFAVPSLRALAHDARFEVVGVITQPDRPVGRHATLTPPPVKVAALELGLPVTQFERVRSAEALAFVQTSNADASVVVSFGQIIPQSILDATRFGAINIHGSLLPKYRGSSPIHAAIREGDETTGVTIMVMDAQLDHGPILALQETTIRPTDTTQELHDRLAERGAALLPDTLIGYFEGRIVPQEQDHLQATSVKMLSREDGRLDPAQQTAIQMERLVRANTPWPGTYVEVGGKRIKALRAMLGETHDVVGKLVTQHGLPGLVCADGKVLLLQEVQPDGKKPMSGEAYLQGYAWTN